VFSTRELSDHHLPGSAADISQEINFASHYFPSSVAGVWSGLRISMSGRWHRIHMQVSRRLSSGENDFVIAPSYRDIGRPASHFVNVSYRPRLKTIFDHDGRHDMSP